MPDAPTPLFTRTRPKRSREPRALTSRSWSLRRKGLFVFLAMLIYAVLMTLYAWREKENLLKQFESLQELHVTESSLRQTEMAALLNIMTLIMTINTEQNANLERIRAHLQALQRHQESLMARLPETTQSFASLSHALAQAYKEPTQANLQVLGQQVNVTREQLLRLADLTRVRQRQLAQEYHDAGNQAALRLVGLAILGVVVIGAVSFFFFDRLTRDLRRLRYRVDQIVRGYRGSPLTVDRRDEVGELIRGVNHMVEELEEREEELELERRKSFFQEKIAAIGSLAAGIMHEIGNPIAAIAGLVQSMRDDPRSSLSAEEKSQLELVLEQTERLMVISRDVSDFSTQESHERELLDLNTVVSNTCRLLRFDKRLRDVDVECELDPMLPAINGIADQLTQLIMNLLLNAADALEGIENRRRYIRVITEQQGGRVLLTVEDNGQGMDEEAIENAFYPFFTTKPPGKGTGLGLSVCHSVVESHQGQIDIDSTVGTGTRVRVALNID